jgi:uncharacterized membrane protein
MHVTKSNRLRAELRAHPRLFIAAGVGMAIGLLMPEAWSRLVHMIIGWNAAAAFYLALSWTMMLRETEQRIRWRAKLNDETGPTMLFLSAAAAAVSLGAIVGLLSGFKDLPEASKTPHLALAVFTILCSWFFLHTIFTVHYAHEFYGSAGSEGHERGGLQFPGDTKSFRYLDFAYFSFTIGMTAQTSDTAVTTLAMRRMALIHGILAFFFNTVILAFSVNIAASLL